MRSCGIQARPAPKRLHDVAAVRAFYEHAGLSLKATAARLGVSIDTLQRALPVAVVPRHRLMRERASQWKGGRRVSTQGYVMIYAPDHPRATSNGYVFEHVLVAERHHGAVPPTAVVHHRNGCRTDNRPENLQVMTRAEHVAHHRGERRHA